MSRFLSFLLTATLLLSAGPARAQDEDPLLPLCRILIEQKPPKTRMFPMVKDVLRSTFSPMKYAAPVTAGELLGETGGDAAAAEDTTLDWNATAGLDFSGPPPAPTENVIFSFAPIEAQAAPAVLAAHLAERKTVQKRMDRLFKTHRRLARLKSVDECVARARADGYDPAEFPKLAKRRSELIDAELAAEQRPLARSIRKTLRKLRLSWTLIEVTELDQVKAALADPRTRNVVLLHHAMDSGQLIDSGRHGYPKSFFEGVSPALQSLSVFSCHAQKARALYSLDRVLGIGRVSGRRLFTAKESRFLGKEGVVPMGVFRKFLAEIDRELSESAPPKPAAPSAASAQCPLRVRGATAIGSDYGLFVGGRYAGSLKQGASEAVIPVPCESIARANPDVRLVMLSIHDRSDLRLDGARIDAQDGRSWAVGTSFPRDDRTLSSVKFIQNR